MHNAINMIPNTQVLIYYDTKYLPLPDLCDDQVLEATCRNIIRASSIARRRPIIPRNNALLLVCQILVDPRHPRVNLVCKEALSAGMHMLRPLLHLFSCAFR